MCTNTERYTYTDRDGDTIRVEDGNPNAMTGDASGLIYVEVEGSGVFLTPDAARGLATTLNTMAAEYLGLDTAA